MPEKILQRGAEANIILVEEDGNFIIKDRVKKGYRLSEIDEEIRNRRTRAESRLLLKASKVTDVPEIKNVNEKNKEISMEFVDGKKLSESLDLYPLKEQKKICNTIGRNIAKLHDSDIIHGDLTTSNMIFKGGKVFFVDFGLGFNSHKIEDKAVDLHLLRQALEARHYGNWGALFAEVGKGYALSKNSEKVLEKLKKVEARGRYKGRY